MKAPGDKRPCWREGIIQIHITRTCDLSCIGCTQGSNLAGKPIMMNIFQFEDAVKTLKDYYGVIGIFGGNPCVHPNFPLICKILEHHIPFEQRGLWSNNLNGHGKLCAEIFNPEVSNLNVHTSLEAYLEMMRDWPTAQPKGLNDSRHSPPYVAMKDLNIPEDEMWKLIEKCDINQYWSAMIGIFRGELRAWFCELAGAQSMLHSHEPDYPDTGIPVMDGWWKKPIQDFQHQINKHCPECGIPLRGAGALAVTGNTEMVSKTHENIYKLKRPTGKIIKLIDNRMQLGGMVPRATDYVENGYLTDFARA